MEALTYLKNQKTFMQSFARLASNFFHTGLDNIPRKYITENVVVSEVCLINIKFCYTFFLALWLPQRFKQMINLKPTIYLINKKQNVKTTNDYTCLSKICILLNSH